MPDHDRQTAALAKMGERLARRYLQKLGYRHLASNYAANGGEVDLVMDDDGTLAFVEVKTRRRESFVPAEGVVNYRKRRHLAAAARRFIQRYRLHDRPCRFDVVVVILDDNDQTQLRHLPHAFPLPR